MGLDNLCQFLNWDSDFFGSRIARITVTRLNHNTVNAILEWCISNNIDCVYFLSDVDDELTMRLVEDNDFHFMDIRITFEQYIKVTQILDNNHPKYKVRHSTLDDVSTLRAIARANHRGTRFYFDPNFPTYLCDSLYETWIEKSCNGYADTVLVADFEGQPVGYLSCHLVGQNKGQIGLLGVGKDWQGMGLGQKLVIEALNWFVLQGVSQVEVVTQGRNNPSQRLYQSCGFLTKDVQLWYHRWFSDGISI